jgi:hypothetical protein
MNGALCGVQVSRFATPERHDWHESHRESPGVSSPPGAGGAQPSIRA